MCITIAANIAETAILTYPACFPDSVVGFIADGDKANVYFIEYMFRRLRTSLQHQASGSVQDNINLATLDRLRFPLPPIDEQRAIASVLGALDDKIEQNGRTARALEGLARAIFRAWFVDFEPVKAKAAGATTFPSMPQPVFDALPTRFADSDFGPIPLGWKDTNNQVAELENADCVQIGDGYRAKRAELADSGLPFIRAGNVDGTIETKGAELLGLPAVAKAGVKRSQVWDTVFTSKGTVGRIGIVTPATGDVVYAPQVCFWRTVNPTRLSPFYLHLWMKSELFSRQWMAVKGETDMADFVSLSDQRAMNMFVPPPDVQGAFTALVQPLIELGAHLMAESSKLAELRDYLLPKLLSGEARVEAAHG
jgi:type I restriction enzyme, S subunit